MDSKYSYVVFGAGRQGTAAIYDLVKNCQAAKVLVVEPDARRLDGAAQRLQKLLKNDASKLKFARKSNGAALKGFDVVLSCATYRANIPLTKMSLKAGIPFCDLGGNPETVAEQEKLAARKSTAVVPDCGVSPGLSNILAVHCAKFHRCDTVQVRCGGLPLVKPDKKTNPLQYKLVFSPMGLISEYSGKVPIIREGKLAWVEALGKIETFDEEHESSPTSNNSPQVVEFLLRCGVKRYDYATLRYNGHWQLAQGWKSLGYLQNKLERDLDLAAQLDADPVLRYTPGKDRDKLLLCVRGWLAKKGMKKGFEYFLDVAADRKTQFSAMELTTSWGITIVAHHMASGRGKPKGFATPERFVQTSWVIQEIERRLSQLSF